MKLYATATSERASKGQGGNDYMTIEIVDGARQPILSLYMFVNDNNTADIKLREWATAKTHYLNTVKLGAETKGEKQKGEKRDYCTAGHKEFTENCPACADNIPF